MQVAYFADEVSRDDFEEAVRLGVEAGATGVELRGGIWGRRVQDVLARFDAKVMCVGSPVGKCAHDSDEEKSEHQRMFGRMVELAHAFETPVIRGFALWNPWRRERGKGRPDVQEYLDVIVPFLEPIVKSADTAGVTLSLENEGATLAGSCAEVRAVSEALGNPPAFTYCWDVNNGAGCGERAFPEGYEQIRGKVTHLHVKPNEGKALDPIRGTQVAYRELLETLVADGYQGVASIEHWGSPELMLKGIRELRAVVDGMGAGA